MICAVRQRKQAAVWNDVGDWELEGGRWRTRQSVSFNSRSKVLMVPPVVLPPLYWSYWANAVFILGMFGYLTMDTVSYLSLSTETNLIATIYTFLSLLFIVDAILYTIDWYMYAVRYRETPNHPIHYRAELVACIFHNIGSQCYFIGSLFSFNRPRFIKEFLLLNFIGILAFLFESGFTFLGWIVTFKRGPAHHPRYTCTSQVRTKSIMALNT